MKSLKIVQTNPDAWFFWKNLRHLSIMDPNSYVASFCGAEKWQMRMRSPGDTMPRATDNPPSLVARGPEILKFAIRPLYHTQKYRYTHI
jgi:hypothetical protein